MLGYIARRLLYMMILLVVLSIAVFVIIQLPPGDFLTNLLISMRNSGIQLQQQQIAEMEHQYGLSLPLHQQYFKWVWNLLHGDMGRSFQ